MDPSNMNNEINSSSDKSMEKIMMELSEEYRGNIEPEDSYFLQTSISQFNKTNEFDNFDFQQMNMTIQEQNSGHLKDRVCGVGTSENVSVAFNDETKGDTSSFQNSGISNGLHGNEQGSSRNQIGLRTSMEDAAALKRKTRLIKNRESAARSRSRKLARTLQLNIEINNLEKENRQLRNELQLTKISQNSRPGCREHELKRSASASNIEL